MKAGRHQTTSTTALRRVVARRVLDGRRHPEFLLPIVAAREPEDYF
jgi:hypothetical protein